MIYAEQTMEIHVTYNCDIRRIQLKQVEIFTHIGLNLNKTGTLEKKEGYCKY